MIFLYIDPFFSGIGRKIQVLFTITMITFVISCKKSFLSNKIYKQINFYIYLLLTSIIISSLLNKDLNFVDTDISSYTLGILYAIMIFTFLYFVEYVNFRKKSHILFKYFYNLSLLTCIIIDILTITVGTFANEFYYIGSKFTLAYLHIFTCALYCLKNYNQHILPHKSKIIYALILLSFLISIYIKCSTGIIGTLVISILLLKKNILYKKISSASGIILCIILFSLLSFSFAILTQFQIVQFIIVDVLKEDLTLTGRTRIYAILADAITHNTFFGWGQDNGMAFLRHYYNTPNAQNGLFNFITDYGIIGTAAFLTAIYNIYSKAKNPLAYPIRAIIFTFIVLSSVEITFNLQFIAYLILLIPFTTTNNIKS